MTFLQLLINKSRKNLENFLEAGIEYLDQYRQGDGSEGKKVTVTFETKDGTQTDTFDKLIVAVGRKPFTEGLPPMVVVLRKTNEALLKSMTSVRPKCLEFTRSAMSQRGRCFEQGL